MAQNRMGHKPGGGLHSRNVRHVTAPKIEPRARAKSPGGVGQIGAMQGNHITSVVNTNYRGEGLERGRGYNAPVGPTNLAQQGPGAGREVMKSGQQSQHGPVAGTNKPAGRDILSSYGPDYRK